MSDATSDGAGPTCPPFVGFRTVGVKGSWSNPKAPSRTALAPSAPVQATNEFKNKCKAPEKSHQLQVEIRRFEVCLGLGEAPTLLLLGIRLKTTQILRGPHLHLNAIITPRLARSFTRDAKHIVLD